LALSLGIVPNTGRSSTSAPLTVRELEADERSSGRRVQSLWALARRPLLDRMALPVPLKKRLIHPNY